MSGKRTLTWPELDGELRAAALAKLRRLAELKAKADGIRLPYAWAERVAPLLHFKLCGRHLWTCTVPRAARKAHSIFTLPVLPVEDVRP